MKLTFFKSLLSLIFVQKTNSFTEEEMKAVAVKAYDNLLEEQYKEKLRSDTVRIRLMIGKPIISVSNQWENPVIGIVIGVAYLTRGDQPVAKVYNFLTDRVVLCAIPLIPCTKSNLDAVLLLNPFQCWNLINRTCIETSSATPSELLSQKAVRQILKFRSFDKVVESLEFYMNCIGSNPNQDYVHTEKQVMKILNTYGLNTDYNLETMKTP